MIKPLSLLLLLASAFSAHAATITFQPNAQSIALGASTTVDVRVSGLSANQVIGAFDLFVLNNASIIKATNLTFFSALGAPGSELTDFSLGSSSVEAAETSFESSATLLGLQNSSPFSIFRLTYMGVGAGTSSLTLGSPLYLADGTGAILPAPTVVAGSITVVGGTPVTTTPEPSSLALLGSGSSLLLVALRRRKIA